MRHPYLTFISSCGTHIALSIILTIVGPGASGTWVVDGNALLGIIIAVYDNEPYAHMIPIASIFSGIQDMFSKHSKHPEVHILKAECIEKRRQELPRTSQPRASFPNVETTSLESIIQPVAEINSIVQPTANSPTMTRSEEKFEEYSSNPLPQVVNTSGTQNAFQLRAFFPMCLVVFLIGLVSF